MVSRGFGTQEKDESYWRSYSAPQPRSYMFPGLELVSLNFYVISFLLLSLSCVTTGGHAKHISAFPKIWLVARVQMHPVR
jgi:hypothetical protein